MNFMYEPGREEESAARLLRERPVCAWCQNPIMEAEYYGIDNEAVCRDCIEACRCEQEEDAAWRHGIKN